MNVDVRSLCSLGRSLSWDVTAFTSYAYLRCSPLARYARVDLGSLLTISFYDKKEAIVETCGTLIEKIKE